MDAKQVWRAALGELQVSLSPANFETWLRDTQLVDVDDQRFRISVPNGFAKDWLETRYRSLISQTLARIVGYSVQVEFFIAVTETPSSDSPDGGNGSFEALLASLAVLATGPRSVGCGCGVGRGFRLPLVGPFAPARQQGRLIDTLLAGRRRLRLHDPFEDAAASRGRERVPLRAGAPHPVERGAEVRGNREVLDLVEAGPGTVRLCGRDDGLPGRQHPPLVPEQFDAQLVRPRPGAAALPR